MPELIDALIVLAIIAGFSLVTIKKKSLDKEGALIAGVLGWLIFWIGGMNYFVTTLFFFIAGDVVTRFSKQKKPKHEKRTTGNIVGNGGAAFIALSLNSPIGFFAALGAALADTFSSEIGILSKEKTVLITNPKKEVPAGTDGGITLLGFEAAILGAAVMAILYYFFIGNGTGTIIVIIAGFFGSAIDSLLGAVFEKRGILNNTEVNFLASGCGALTGYFALTLV